MEHLLIVSIGGSQQDSCSQRIIFLFWKKKNCNKDNTKNRTLGANKKAPILYQGFFVFYEVVTSPATN